MEAQLIKTEIKVNLTKNYNLYAAMSVMNFQVIFIVGSVFFATNCIGTQNIILPLPDPYINGIKITHDLSFVDKLGFNLEPTEREIDEAYGVDSIYYYSSDSITLVYLIEKGKRGLAGVSMNCSACFGFSQTTKIRRGDKILDLINIYPKLFEVSNPDKKINDKSPEEISKWISIRLKISNLGGVVSIYDYGLVNFSLKDGIIVDSDIQYYME